MATVTGWGHLTFNGTQSEVLHEVTVPTKTYKECLTETAYATTDWAADYLNENMVCAGEAAGGKDACEKMNTDSGGPLVTPGSSGSMEQIGMVSWGYRCAEPNYPRVYTRVGNMS
ncbi:hypothetical protein O3P69_006266 [Scylla paramamosain]|uniref:Peptidase S1 domain-containing protein n=1 Tax=Scylla paramamosain TaxID=85552 RepID=A0AAW0U5X0_SCYPA